MNGYSDGYILEPCTKDGECYSPEPVRIKTTREETGRAITQYGPNREAFVRTDPLNQPVKLKGVLFYSKGLLPTNDDVFWIHKRRKSGGCPGAAGPTKTTCPKVSGELGSRHRLDPAVQQPKVVIVGAGLAGLTAAAKLADAGFKNFQVVEATDRLGGRIHSCWVGDSVAELGPLWLTRATLSNPLYTLAAQEGLLKPPLVWRRKPDFKSTVFLTSDGGALDPAVVLPSAFLFERIRDEATALYGLEVSGKGSLEQFMANRLAEESKAIPEEWRSTAFSVFWSLANEYKGRFGAAVGKLSSSMFGSQTFMPGGSLRIPLGLLGILGPLLKKVDMKCIATCRTVQNICWQGEQRRAVVRLAEGNEVLEADYVLVTVPLGVLRARPEMFSPCLPEEKHNAMQKLGWATTNRFVLSYEKPFWLPGEAFYRFVWTKEELANKNSWIKGLSVIEEVSGSSNLLTFCLGDEEASMTEGCADDSIAEEVTKALRRFSGDPSLPLPKGVLRSKWGSDPHFLGSTSYQAAGSSPADHCELGRPVPVQHPVLLFAGEATVPGNAASLLGAHLSGLREAERILDLTAKYAGTPCHGM